MLLNQIFKKWLFRIMFTPPPIGLKNIKHPYHHLEQPHELPPDAQDHSARAQDKGLCAFLSCLPLSPHKLRGSRAHPALGGQGREGLETEGQDRTQDQTQTTSSKPSMEYS